MDVRVTIPYTALLGADDQPGELAGFGPLPAAVGRDLTAGGTWRRILADPASGRPLDYGTTRYRPPARLAGLVITRDQTCQFPGCRVPAHRCDIDHSIPHNPANSTGPTSETNLGPDGVVRLVGAIVRGTPSLAGAACRGRYGLFDDKVPGETPQQRQQPPPPPQAAVTVCGGLPGTARVPGVAVEPTWGNEDPDCRVAAGQRPLSTMITGSGQNGHCVEVGR